MYASGMNPNFILKFFLGRIQYDKKSNNIVGYTLPLDPATGFPISNSFQATNAHRIQNIVERNEKSTYAYVIVAQPLEKNSPSFALCVFGTNNRFMSLDVIKRWRTIKVLCEREGIEVYGYSSDGDPKLLKAMRIWTGIPLLTIPENQPNWFQCNFDFKQPLVLQDTVHIGNRLG